MLQSLKLLASELRGIPKETGRARIQEGFSSLLPALHWNLLSPKLGTPLVIIGMVDRSVFNATKSVPE